MVLSSELLINSENVLDPDAGMRQYALDEIKAVHMLGRYLSNITNTAECAVEDMEV